MTSSQRPTTSHGRRLAPERALGHPRSCSGSGSRGPRAKRFPSRSSNNDHQPKLSSTGGCGNLTPRERSSSYVPARSSHQKKTFDVGSMSGTRGRSFRRSEDEDQLFVGRSDLDPRSSP